MKPTTTTPLLTSHSFHRDHLPITSFRPRNRVSSLLSLSLIDHYLHLIRIYIVFLLNYLEFLTNLNFPFPSLLSWSTQVTYFGSLCLTGDFSSETLTVSTYEEFPRSRGEGTWFSVSVLTGVSMGSPDMEVVVQLTRSLQDFPGHLVTLLRPSF